MAGATRIGGRERQEAESQGEVPDGLGVSVQPSPVMMPARVG
jgi:hypothetical protein